MPEDLTQLITALSAIGGTIALYAAFGKWIKAWVIRGLVDKDWLEHYLFNTDDGKLILQKTSLEQKLADLREYVDKEIAEAKESAEKDLKNHKERSDEKDEADKKWLNELQGKVEKLQIKVGE